MRTVLQGLLTAALLPTLGAAFGGVLEPNDFGLVPGYDAASRPWKSAVARSNASASYTFKGRDVTKPFPSSEMDGWTINITAVNLSPVALGWDLKVMAPPSLYSKVDPRSVNGSDAEVETVVEANGQVITNVDRSWFFCTFVSLGGSSFPNSTQGNNPEDKSTKPDGDCSPFISQSCIDAIEKYASTSYGTGYTFVSNPYNVRGACGGFDLPKECGDAYWDFGGDVWNRLEAPLRYMTGATTLVDGWEFAKDKDEEEIDPIPSDAPAMWKSITQDFVAVITMFGKYKNGTGGYHPGQPEPGFTKLSCVRPELHDEGKTKGDSGKSDGKSDGKGSGAGVTVTASLLLMGAAVMLML